MLKVKDWSGEEVPFDEAKATQWVVKNLGLPRTLARSVAWQVSIELGDRTVEARELLLASARLSIQAVGRAGAASERARGGGRVFASLDPATLASAAGTAAGLLGGALGGGWEKDGPDGWKKEKGSAFLFFDDANAPQILRVTTDSRDCCTDTPPQGVRLRLIVSVTDDSGSFGNDSGVRRVRALPIHPRFPDLSSDDGAGEETLDTSQNKQSQDEAVRVELDVCVPCAFIVRNIALVGIRVTDDDGNERFVVKPFDVTSKADCCRGA
jgi:hypothetical protein